MLDKYAAGIIKDIPNMAIPWYLMSSYAYYELDNPILSDGMFDKLGKVMLSSWSSLEHVHKSLITEDDLEAGTQPSGGYPEIVKGATCRLINGRLPKKKRTRPLY